MRTDNETEKKKQEEGKDKARVSAARLAAAAEVGRDGLRQGGRFAGLVLQRCCGPQEGQQVLFLLPRQLRGGEGRGRGAW